MRTCQQNEKPRRKCSTRMCVCSASSDGRGIKSGQNTIMNQKQKGSAHSNAEATLASRLEAGILGDVRIVEIVVFDEVKIALKGGEGGRLSRDLMRLGGTEECSGDAEAGDEEEKGGADHSSAVGVRRLGGCGSRLQARRSSSCHVSIRCQPVSVRARTYVRTYVQHVHLLCHSLVTLLFIRWLRHLTVISRRETANDNDGIGNDEESSDNGASPPLPCLCRGRRVSAARR